MKLNINTENPKAFTKYEENSDSTKKFGSNTVRAGLSAYSRV